MEGDNITSTWQGLDIFKGLKFVFLLDGYISSEVLYLVVHHRYVILTLRVKKQDTLLVLITLQNVDRFSKLFHC